MSKIRTDQFPSYTTVYLRQSRLDWRKILSVFLHRCVSTLLSEISTHPSISKNIENLSSSSMESPLYIYPYQETLWSSWWPSSSYIIQLRDPYWEII